MLVCRVATGIDAWSWSGGECMAYVAPAHARKLPEHVPVELECVGRHSMAVSSKPCCPY